MPLPRPSKRLPRKRASSVLVGAMFPITEGLVGATAASVMPTFRQLFLSATSPDGSAARAKAPNALLTVCASAPNANPASTSP